MGSMNNSDCHDVWSVCACVCLIERVSKENSKPVISFFFEMTMKTALQWLLFLHYHSSSSSQCAFVCTGVIYCCL